MGKYIALVEFRGGGYNYIGPEDDLKELILSAKTDWEQDPEIIATYVEDCVDGMPHNVGADPYWMATRDYSEGEGPYTGTGMNMDEPDPASYGRS